MKIFIFFLIITLVLLTIFRMGFYLIYKFWYIIFPLILIYLIFFSNGAPRVKKQKKDNLSEYDPKDEVKTEYKITKDTKEE